MIPAGEDYPMTRDLLPPSATVESVTFTEVEPTTSPAASVGIIDHEFDGTPAAAEAHERIAAVWVQLADYGYWHVTGDNTGPHPLVVWEYQIEPLIRLLRWCKANTPEQISPD